ncbi:ATP-binding protein [Peterkaempfera bronchialis]|uniref:ATP-binding protein n=1 Tax=Peterkaempfera bronchialis TaxID=2126346 RepID=UPI003C2E6469
MTAEASINSPSGISNGESGVAAQPRLTLLTFADLIADIEKFSVGARLEAKRSAWRNLLALAQRLREKSEAVEDPTVGASWHLTSVTVTGYQGATNTVIMKVDPSPGITIVHGPNGAGKSTIADGIHTAISGSTRWWTSSVPTTGRTKREPLWERVHRARDAEHSLAEITLTRAQEKLILTCILDSAGEVESCGAEWTDTSGRVRDIDLGATAWPHAVAGHPPVFAYADVERRVQQSTDLREYIENLLALGGCFVALESQVATLSAEAETSKKLIDNSAKLAKGKISKIDEEHRRSDATSETVQIDWPSWVDDIDSWLEDNGLTDTGGPLPEITAAHEDAVASAAQRVTDALRAIDEVPDSIKQRLAGSLRSLHDHALELDQTGETCPVCDSEILGWLDRLRVNVGNLSELDPLFKRAAQALAELNRTLDRHFDDVIHVLTSAEDSPRITSDLFIGQAQQSVEDFRSILTTYGCQPTPHARRSYEALRALMATAEWRKAFAEAMSLSAYERQWRQRRRAAVDDFVAVWRENSATAREHQLWLNTLKCVKDLATQLRERRSEHFTQLAGSRVKNLLEDAGIVLEDVRLTTQRAEVKVNNPAGQPLSLAMLSAGQRNAFLLAPLLATIDAGPFSFLVLDDPVHAFDEIRVDRLASVLAEISEKRRVLVFTHDERLKQHLLARSLNCQAWAISRDLDTGVISLQQTDELWRVLLDDAEAVWRLSPKNSTSGYLTETQIIRGLCRQAIDNALHQCIIRHALSNNRDVAEDLREVDANASTMGRMDAASQLVSVPPGSIHPVSEASARCGIYLKLWNNAVHGANSTKSDLKQEIDIARKACAILAGR